VGYGFSRLILLRAIKWVDGTVTMATGPLIPVILIVIGSTACSGEGGEGVVGMDSADSVMMSHLWNRFVRYGEQMNT
tara:strand:+ start:156 stop:386 length:231 start_codon:yes stop_codon:yes gene_type:complete